MDPRLKTSKKWTALPKEFLAQVRNAFKSTFKDHLGTAKIEADGRIYPEELLISVGYKIENALKQSNFMVSIPYRKGKDDVLKLLNLGMDAVGALFEQLFQADDDQDFPRLWQEVDFEGRQIYVQYVTNNTELDAAADKLLGEDADESLTGGEWDEEEDDGVTPEEIKSKLGLDDDDEDGGQTH